MSAKVSSRAARAATGKIAALSFELREGICLRMKDGWTGKRIIAWLAEQGVSGVNEQNLTNWRHADAGYRAWGRDQERLETIRAQAESTRRSLEAGGNAIFDRLAVEYAQALADLRGAADEVSITRLAGATASLINAATARQRAAVHERRADLAADHLDLERQKFRYQLAENILKFAQDARAQAIASGGATHDDKIKALLAYIEEQEAEG